MSQQHKGSVILVGVVWSISILIYLGHLLTKATIPTRTLASFAAANLTISWSALYLVIGFATGLTIIVRLAQQKADAERENEQFILTAVLPTLICALIFARLYHILTPPPSFAAVGLASLTDYLSRPEQILNLQRGGLGLYGALLGGTLGLLYAAWRHRQPFLPWLDRATVGFAAGLAIGRWSNFVAQDMVGQPTNLPWGMFVDLAFRPEPFISFNTFHPAFLYESIWMLVIFWLLLRQISKQRATQHGSIALRFLFLYGIGRFLIEFIRADVRLIAGGPLSITAVIALTTALFALLLLWLRSQGDKS